MAKRIHNLTIVFGICEQRPAIFILYIIKLMKINSKNLKSITLDWSLRWRWISDILIATIDKIHNSLHRITFTGWH